jgi:hypothetical protein
MDTNVWNEGFRTGVKAVELAEHPGDAAEDVEKLSCPYSEQTTEAWAWASGFVEGWAEEQGKRREEEERPGRVKVTRGHAALTDRECIKEAQARHAEPDR